MGGFFHGVHEEDDYSHRLKIRQISDARRQATGQVLTWSSSAVNDYEFSHRNKQLVIEFCFLFKKKKFLQANDKFL